MVCWVPFLETFPFPFPVKFSFTGLAYSIQNRKHVHSFSESLNQLNILPKEKESFIWDSINYYISSYNMCSKMHSYVNYHVVIQLLLYLLLCISLQIALIFWRLSLLISIKIEMWTSTHFCKYECFSTFIDYEHVISLLNTS